MPAAEGKSPQIVDASSYHCRAAAKIPVVEDPHARSAIRLDRRDVIAKVLRQSRQLIAGTHAEAVPAKRRCCKEASSTTRVRPLVPSRFPARMIPINPRSRSLTRRRSLRWPILRHHRQSEHDKEQSNPTFHFERPPVAYCNLSDYKLPRVSRQPPEPSQSHNKPHGLGGYSTCSPGFAFSVTRIIAASEVTLNVCVNAALGPRCSLPYVVFAVSAVT